MKHPSIQRLVQFSLILVFLAPFAGFLLVLNLRPEIPDARFQQDSRLSHDAALSITWLGAGGVHVSDGETSFATDAFFSRPPLGRVLWGEIGPDPARIRAGLALAHIDRLDAVIPLHSHYDHLLDAPWLADHFGAMLIGSRSSANAARGSGLPEALIRQVKAGETLQLGRFRLTFLRSAHAPMAPLLERLSGHGQEIRHPFSTPAELTAWHEGKVFALVVRHPRGSLLIHSTAGFTPGFLSNQADVDIALLSTALLSRQSPRFRQRWFKEVVADSGARRVIPIHWDDIFRPLSHETPPMPRFMDNFHGSLEALEEPARAAGISVELRRPLDRLAPLTTGINPRE